MRFNVAVSSISLYHNLSPQSTHHIKRKSVARVSSKTASYHSQSPSRRLVDKYDNDVGNDGNDYDIDVYYDKHEGRVTLPKRMNFRKVPKKGGCKRPFGTFPKIHPFWNRHPVLLRFVWILIRLTTMISIPALHRRVYRDPCQKLLTPGYFSSASKKTI